jgi:adenine/guanine phosphoribosyltransferase-like PRPP-binding protein
MWKRMSEGVWREAFYTALDDVKGIPFDFVTGPGRSGHLAAVYASHYLGLPFIPHKTGNYFGHKRVLVVDTVEYTGKTLRKAEKWYAKRGMDATSCFAIKETKGHYYKMWYEI